MKRSTMRTAITGVIFTLVGLCSSTGASAATNWTGSWSYSACSQAATNSGNWGNSYNCSDSSSPSDATMNLSAWSADLNPVTNFTSSFVADYGSSAGFGLVSREECGFGAVCNPGTGPHAADNWANLDGFLMKFAPPTSPSSDVVTVALNSITIGWNGTDNATGSTGGTNYNDSDISVYYYTGTTAPDMTTVNNANLTSNGWKLLGNYADVGGLSGNTVNLGNCVSGTGCSGTAVSSSWWLVTASNSTLGTASSSDAFKLLGAGGAGTTTKRVSEPGSLALASMALFGAIYTRRRFGNSRKS